MRLLLSIYVGGIGNGDACILYMHMDALQILFQQSLKYVHILRRVSFIYYSYFCIIRFDKYDFNDVMLPFCVIHRYYHIMHKSGAIINKKH